MNSAITSFDKFFNIFKSQQLWIDMVNTCENSPWHREDNVGVHTQMLIDHYKKNYANIRSEKQNILSLVACLMHDIGKPPAEVTKTSEARGEYRSYAGHEQLSARLWVDYALSNIELIKDLLKFNITDIANIAMMLEYHVPFGIKHPRKLSNMRDSIKNRMGDEGHRAWIDFIMCDQNGRISDDQETKLAAVHEWFKKWETL